MKKIIVTSASLVFALSILCSCNQSKGRILPVEHTIEVEDHEVVIVDTSGVGGSNTLSNMSNGMVFTHDGGNCRIRLENESLTVNGKKYLIANKKDSIRIEDDRVQINGKKAKPEDR